MGFVGSAAIALLALFGTPLFVVILAAAVDMDRDNSCSMWSYLAF